MINTQAVSLFLSFNSDSWKRHTSRDLFSDVKRIDYKVTTSQ